MNHVRHRHGRAPRLVLGIALSQRLQVAPAVSQLRLRALRALPLILRIRARARCLAPRSRGLPLRDLVQSSLRRMKDVLISSAHW